MAKLSPLGGSDSAMGTQQPGSPAITIRGLSRNFGVVRALEEVSFDVPVGEVTALLGENGAGKSTLLKILAGLQPPSGGSVSFFDREVTSYSPNAMLTEHSVAIVPQELSLLLDRTVAENILAGVEPGNRFFPSHRAMVQRTVSLLDELGLRIDPNRPVRELDLATQQRGAAGWQARCLMACGRNYTAASRGRHGRSRAQSAHDARSICCERQP